MALIRLYIHVRHLTMGKLSLLCCARCPCATNLALSLAPDHVSNVHVNIESGAASAPGCLGPEHASNNHGHGSIDDDLPTLHSVKTAHCVRPHAPIKRLRGCISSNRHRLAVCLETDLQLPPPSPFPPPAFYPRVGCCSALFLLGTLPRQPRPSVSSAPLLTLFCPLPSSRP